MLAFFSIENEFESKLNAKKFLPTTEFYTTPVIFHSRDQLNIEKIEKTLTDAGFRHREAQQILFSGDYVVLDSAQCIEKLKLDKPEGLSHCAGYVNKGVSEKNLSSLQQWILVKDSKEILQTFQAFPLLPTAQAMLEPQLFAQYTDKKPIMQKFKTLSEIPPQCLNAVMSIEDNNFLEHSGFSASGILRALYKNLTSGHKAQGGSTITQQLVKNYFLSNERSYKRKIQELVMAVLLESKYSKDEILETYLNIIYMGQSGPFQVLGFGAAANYYFGKEIRELNIAECSLLAAVLNGPGVYDPWSKKDKSLQRRNLVLTKMKDFNYISESEMLQAQKAELPTARPRQAAETAPYYIDAVRRQLAEAGIATERTKIYTYLNLQWQQTAQDALQKHLENLETNNKYIKKIKATGQNLEGVVLAGDPRTGAFSVAVGGRSFRMTQFNRIVDSHRQIGSIMKPFVFLTALEKGSSTKKYLPLTVVNDEKFEIKYDKQTWSPDNYSKKYYGQIPLFYALKNSLNTSTASVGLDVGLDNIIQTVKNYQIKSLIKPLPSLTLGAFEMVPSEVLRAYMGFSQMGKLPKTSFVVKVTDLENKILFEHNPETQQVSDPAATASLVSMMKQTILTGTAHSVTTAGFLKPAAGKTGTTSDFKDAWFVGYTPFEAALVWVGYDNNTATQLTGSSGAVPVWLDLMKKMSEKDPVEDFTWPENTVKVHVTQRQLQEIRASQETEDMNDVELIYPKGSEP